jgi:hypothetical protein
MNALNERQDPNRWYLPPMLILCVAPLISGPLAGAGLHVVNALRAGQWWIPASALVFSGIGIVLLFVSKLPLYRQRRFFTFGPRLLNTRHRRLFRWSYCFIAVGLLLMVCVLLALR